MKNILIKISLVVTVLLTLQAESALAMSKRLPREPSSGSDPKPQPTPTPTPSPSPTPAPPSNAGDATPLWEAKAKDGKEWTAHVLNQLDHLGQNLLDVIPADRSLFCPKYSSLSYAQRKQYWAFLISSMVRFESNFKPETSYKEDFKDSKGNYIVSRGLLQISIESANSYGCGFKSSSELHDPYKNLSCGIRILDRWLDRDGRIAGKVDGKWRGGARYWAVMRAADKTSYKSIVKWSQELSMCN